MSSRKKGKDTSTVTFRAHGSIALTAGAASIQASPSGFGTICPRFTQLADGWAHFRLLSLRFRLIRNAAITAAQAACYLGGVQDTPPAAIGTIMQELPSTYLSTVTTVPTEWARPSASELSGAMPWYKSINGGADSDEEAPGYLHLCGTGTEVVEIEIFVTIQFKTAVATTSTPALVELQSRIHQELVRKERQAARDSALRLLGSVPSPAFKP